MGGEAPALAPFPARLKDAATQAGACPAKAPPLKRLLTSSKRTTGERTLPGGAMGPA